jgi:hypothetical protein
MLGHVKVLQIDKFNMNFGKAGVILDYVRPD